MSDPPIRPDYESQTIRISDLAVTSDVIENRVFSNCSIVGPAVMVLIGGTVISGCTFDVPGGDVDAMLIVVRESRHLVGVIGLIGCEFYGCRFSRVAFVVNDSAAEMFREARPG